MSVDSRDRTDLSISSKDGRRPLCIMNGEINHNFCKLIFNALKSYLAVMITYDAANDAQPRSGLIY
jgi:hypothetical protein